MPPSCRVACIVLLLSPLFAGEAPAKTWPLWDGRETTAEYARRAGLAETQTLDLGGATMELVLIPAGKFMMGTPEPESPAVGEVMLATSGLGLLVLIGWILVRAWRRRTRPQFSLAYMLAMTLVASVGVWGAVRWRQAVCDAVRYDRGSSPCHEVTLTTPFYIAKYETTQAQYAALIGSNPSQFKAPKNPVECVSWDDAQAFCQRLSAKCEKTVRLPTEAEWEYACRAGTRTTWYTGDSEAGLDTAAWYGANSKDMTHPVGEKLPNAWGICDMHGNVFEWCQDWYEEYAAGAAFDPQGAAHGAGRVLRGGSWSINPQYCRSARRLGSFPGDRDLNCGFRVVVASASRTP